MRILLLAQFYPPDIGGEERHARNLAIGLQARGHEVEVITTKLPETAEGLSVEDGIAVRRIESTAQRVPHLHGDPRRPHALPIADPAMKAAIAERLAASSVDVLHAHNWIVNSALTPARRAGVPVVLTLHDYSHICATKRLMRNGVPCDGPAALRCMQCAVRHFGAAPGPLITVLNARQRAVRERHLSAFVAVSRSVVQRNHLDRSAALVEVIPNFIPDELIGKEDDASIDGPILYLGDLTADKGAAVLLEAYGMLDAPPPLRLVGRAIPGVDLPVVAGAAVLPPCPHDEAMELLRHARIVVVPSVVPDSCPTVVLEAMAKGRPIVASATGGIVDMIEHDKSGLLVRPGDPTQLAASIRALLSDPKDAARLGSAARVAVRDFAASAVIDRLEALYHRLSPRATGASSSSIKKGTFGRMVDDSPTHLGVS